MNKINKIMQNLFFLLLTIWFTTNPPQPMRGQVKDTITAVPVEVKVINPKVDSLSKVLDIKVAETQELKSIAENQAEKTTTILIENNELLKKYSSKRPKRVIEHDTFYVKDTTYYVSKERRNLFDKIKSLNFKDKYNQERVDTQVIIKKNK